MSRPLRILGIETSCDETAAAVVAARCRRPWRRSLGDVVLSQLEEHSAYGGVVPEIAARAHVEALDTLIEEALLRAGVTLSDIDAIAATSGPGLIGGLLVGLMTGKAIARASGKPLYAVNHLEGHALTARLTDGLSFPYLMLLVSGGHTQLILVKDVGVYERWGTTIDDALGEAFDKTAKLLGLPYPGGPAVERRQRAAIRTASPFPRPLVGEARLDFSFSGLKTAVRQAAQSIAPVTDQDIADICASFQKAISRTLKDRIGRGLAAVQGRVRRIRRKSGTGRRRRRCGQPDAARDAAGALRQERLPFRRAAAAALHRQCGDDRLGGCRADGGGVAAG